MSQNSHPITEKQSVWLMPRNFLTGVIIDYVIVMIQIHSVIILAPKRNFEIAFRMFDLDGNGVVDADEFDKVTEIIMKGTTVAKQHKTKKRQSNISRYFFGESKSSL